jgi:zinc protease
MPRKSTGSHSPTGGIASVPQGVTLTTLDNGLTIIIGEDHSAPVVSAQAWAMTGSIHENEWLGAGLSHVLEHMLFKGTERRKPGAIDQEVHDAGGYMNAYTSFDRTVYYIDVPNDGAPVAIDILCDIMQHASLPEVELAKEMDVIRREMDMNQDDPGRRSGRRLFETAYTKSPYRHTIIGYSDIFNQLTREDIVNYYQHRYQPNNVFFVVTGDVVPAEVLKQISEAYAGSPAQPMPPMVLPSEPRQSAQRVRIEESAVELGHVHFSWHIPDIRHEDVPVLDVLSTLLGSGRSSRLFREVREKQAVAHSADAWTYNPGLPGLFGMSAVVDGNKFEAARDAMLAELEKLRKKGPTKAEVSKAVKQTICHTLASRKTMSGQAQDLGSSWLAAGDLNFAQRFLDRVRKVTSADLLRVAQDYLTEDNMTLYALLPEGSLPPVTDRVETAASHDIKKVMLDNGLRLLIKQDDRLPFVQFRMVFQGGVLAESPANNGATALMTKLLLKGTKSRKAEAIAEEIESVGGHLDTYGGNNSLGMTSEVLAEDFDTGLELLADVAQNPAFPKPALERERQVQLAAIKAQRDELLSNCFKLMRRGLFGPQAYGLDNLGTEDSVSKLRVDHLRDLHSQLIVPENGVLAIYGDVDAKGVEAAVKKAFGKWQPETQPRSHYKDPYGGLGNRKRVIEKRDKKQAVLVIGFPSTTLDNPDRYALELIQEACSDLGSRLFMRVREKLGLAYYVGAQNFLGLEPGYFAFYCGTSPEKVDQVEKELLAEAEVLQKNGLTKVELARSKAKVIGQRKIARQELGGYAMSTALDELYGLGYDNYEKEDARYEAVNLAAVQHVAQKYLNPEKCVVAVLRP